MLLVRSLLPGLLLLASTTFSHGQAASTETAPDKLLLKVGLNAGRALRYTGYYGLSMRLPLSVGAEYALSSKFTLYGQADADFRLFKNNATVGDGSFVLPAGGLGVGARYYYNQAGRERHNRPHGSFVGNYLALEAHTEVRQRFGLRNDVAPSLNAVWGMQRRWGRNFLLDFNAGLGLGPLRSDSYLGYTPNNSSLNITTQFNLGVYFGR
ncbi:hypothetical protein [Hymenobacter negativus]|uniref:Outer membrane protein beta-barrel domain-containing protein n=1 Tax=Hymenobacter negativus TaxID=2795026 RepID=A0ABS0Q7F4_9BACT|nr:hypothetical protein [Hymenobacter negativus]MBH8558589.1 hypothetical protein [Hymenobacter negativus]